MSTSYTYSITDCYKNSSGIISSLVVTWIATKEEDGVTYTAKEISHIGLDAAGDNPIAFTDLDEAELKSWYDSKLKTKLTITDVEGNLGQQNKKYSESAILKKFKKNGPTLRHWKDQGYYQITKY